MAFKDHAQQGQGSASLEAAHLPKQTALPGSRNHS